MPADSKHEKEAQIDQKQLSIILSHWNSQPSCSRRNADTSFFSPSLFFSNISLIQHLLSSNQRNKSNTTTTTTTTTKPQDHAHTYPNSHSKLANLHPVIFSNIIAHLSDSDPRSSSTSTTRSLAPLLLSCKSLYSQVIPFLYRDVSINLSKTCYSDAFLTAPSSMIFFGNMFHYNIFSSHARNAIQSLEINLTDKSWIPDFFESVGQPLDSATADTTQLLPIPSLLPNLKSLSFHGIDYMNVDIVKSLLNQDFATFDYDDGTGGLDIHLHGITFNALVDLLPLPPNATIDDGNNGFNTSLCRLIKTLDVSFNSRTVTDLTVFAKIVKNLTSLESLQMTFDIEYPDSQLDLLAPYFLHFFSSLLRISVKDITGITGIASMGNGTNASNESSKSNSSSHNKYNTTPAHRQQHRCQLSKVSISEFPPYLDFVPYLNLFATHSRSSHFPFAFHFDSMGIENEQQFYKTLWTKCSFGELSLSLGYSDYDFFEYCHENDNSSSSINGSNEKQLDGGSVLASSLRSLSLDGAQVSYFQNDNRNPAQTEIPTPAHYSAFQNLEKLTISDIGPVSLASLLDQCYSLKHLYILSIDYSSPFDIQMFQNILRSKDTENPNENANVGDVETEEEEKRTRQASLRIYSTSHHSFLGQLLKAGFLPRSTQIYTPHNPTPSNSSPNNLTTTTDQTPAAESSTSHSYTFSQQSYLSSQHSICISPTSLHLGNREFTLFTSFLDPGLDKLYLQN